MAQPNRCVIFHFIIMSFYRNTTKRAKPKLGVLPPLPNVQQVKDITVEDMMQMFTLEESLRIAYIPSILAEVAFRYIEQIHAISREKRLDNKKECRIIRECVKEYQYTLYNGINKEVLDNLFTQIGKFFDMVSWDITTLYYSINQELKKRYPELKDYEFLTYLNMVIAIIDYMRSFERKMDKVIQERTGRPFASITNPNITKIRDVCNMLANRWHIDFTPIINLSITIIGKKLNDIEFVVTD